LEVKPAIADCSPETFETFTVEDGGGVVVAEVTVTVADWLAELPAPVQVSVYVAFAVRIPVLSEPGVAFAPDQAPEAVQDVALVELQESVEELAEIIELGLAAIVTVGSAEEAVTVTVADWLVEPPAPVQVSEYVAVVVRLPVLCEPEVACVPDQAPEAVHEVALVEVQLRVEVPPEIIEIGLADIVTVGAGVGDPAPYPTRNTWTTGSLLPHESGKTI